MLVCAVSSLLNPLRSPTGLSKSWLWVSGSVYKLNPRKTRAPSLQADGFSHFSASGSATSHVPALAQHLCLQVVFLGQSYVPSFVHCPLLLHQGDRPGVVFLVSLHSRGSFFPSIRFLLSGSCSRPYWYLFGSAIHFQQSVRAGFALTICTNCSLLT